MRERERERDRERERNEIIGRKGDRDSEIVLKLFLERHKGNNEWRRKICGGRRTNSEYKDESK